MSEPSISVVIPAFRQAAFINACLDGIAAQSYGGRIETIVVDDGCPEGSGDIAARHALGPRVVRQANSGVAAARNRGIAEASGELIAFLDADDRWHRDKLERQVARLAVAAVPALCFTRYRRLDPRAQNEQVTLHPAPTLVPTLPELARKNFIGCSTVLLHRACLDRVGVFPDSPELRRGGQDYALWMRVAVHFPLVYLPEVLVDYTVHAASRVGSDSLKNFEGASYALRALDWHDAGVQNAVGASYRRMLMFHVRTLLRDLWAQSADRQTWQRATRATWRALTAS
jgi:glycosyltransferase involved in cell wall biosynthesis